MGLYDIIDEISAHQITKTATGDERMLGVTLGTVAKNYDKDMGGRICVIIPTRDAQANELHWARWAQPYSGKEWGHYFLPEVGDQVLLAFEDGNIESPFVIGCVPLDNNSFLTKSVSADNLLKRIVTRHGSTLLFEDGKDDEGKQDKIALKTAGDAHVLLLDNAGKSIRFSDKAKENFIELKTEEASGTLEIKVKSRLTISVGENIKLTFSGETGAVQLEAKGLSVRAGEQIKLTTDGKLKLEGASVTEKASSTFRVESSGMVNISGSPVKLG